MRTVQLSGGRRRAALAFCAASLLPLAACAAPTDDPSDTASATSPGAQESESAPGAVPDAFGPRVMAEGLEAPWSIVFWNDVTLVSERDSGRILEVADTGEVIEVGIVPDVHAVGEGGLLGLAVIDDSLFVYATVRTPSGEPVNQIMRFALGGEPGAITLADQEIFVDGIPAGETHNGGRLEVGPDGMLYATTGDAARPELSQNPESLAGKILRIDPSGTVPINNPSANSYVYSLGHRNSQGIAWAEDGTMYASEFGQNTWDELNVITAGGNYGWPDVEGIAGEDAYVDPIVQWSPAEASPSGIAIVDDRLYVATLRGEALLVVPLASPDSWEPQYADDFGRLRDVTVAPDGSLWLLTNNTDGRGNPSPEDDRIVSVPHALP